MLDFCELFLCCSSSHTHIARLRSTFSILYMENSLNNAFNLVIGVHLCCINGQIVTLAALSSDSDASWGDGWDMDEKKKKKENLMWPNTSSSMKQRTCFYRFPFSLFLRFDSSTSMYITSSSFPPPLASSFLYLSTMEPVSKRLHQSLRFLLSMFKCFSVSLLLCMWA